MEAKQEYERALHIVVKNKEKLITGYREIT
jgi:hypothetical protein